MGQEQLAGLIEIQHDRFAFGEFLYAIAQRVRLNRSQFGLAGIEPEHYHHYPIFIRFELPSQRGRSQRQLAILRQFPGLESSGRDNLVSPFRNERAGDDKVLPARFNRRALFILIPEVGWEVLHDVRRKDRHGGYSLIGHAPLHFVRFKR